MSTPYRKDTVQRLTEDEDLFAHRDYAAALVTAIADVPSPFTFGLFAPWGAGKSSILEEVGERLRKDGNAFASFDVWKYEGDPLRREFILDVAGQLADQGELKRGFNLREQTERFDKDVTETTSHKLAFDRASLVRGGLLAVLVALGILATLRAAGWLGLSDDTAQKLVLTLTGGLLTFVLTAFGNVVRADPVQVTRKKLEDPDQFARNFCELLKKLKKDRLVIGIDNLDRCAPNRVAELLATIKTFLEPAVEDKQLVFVIAADDAALRRHLIAQELSESAGVGDDDRVGDSVPREIYEAVEEYLRKFFNGTLRVTEVLDEDIREFTKRQLADFRVAHDLDEEATGELVELIASALRRNPRRIKQFINNLEVRLQILEQRRSGGRIQLQPEVLVVAKVAIIEEQWPENFEALKRNPKLLGDWHREASEGGNDAEQEDAASVGPNDWSVFLRLTQQIRPRDLRPYLTLKQTHDELRLPRYRDFADGVEGGSVDVVSTLLEDEEVAPQHDDYVAAVPVLFREKLQQGFYGAANNIVRAVIELPALAQAGAVVLKEALPHPQLRRRLAELPPEALLTAASDLGTTEFNQVVDVLLDKFEATGEGVSADRASISEALAGRMDRLTEDSRTRISRALSNEEIRRDFASYLPVAERSPELLPETTIKDAMDALGSSPSFDRDHPAYRVAKADLLADDEPAYTDIQHLGDTVTISLFTLMVEEEGEERYRELAADAAEVIRRFDVSDTSFQQSLERFDAEWTNIPAPLDASAFEFVGALLDAGTAVSREQYSESFTARFFDETPQAAVTWSDARAPGFGRALTGLIEQRLARIASGSTGEPKLTDSAARVIEGLPDDRSAQTLEVAVVFAIDQGRYERAGELLRRYQDPLGERFNELVNRLLSVAEQDPTTDQPPLLAALTALDPKMLSEDQLRRFGDYVGQATIHGHQGAADAGERMTGSDVFVEATNQAVLRVFGHLAGNPAQLSAYPTQIGFVLDRQDHLSETQRFQLGTMLVERVRDSPAETPMLAPLAGRLASLGADERYDLVTKLILAERTYADQPASYGPYREPVLRGARDLAGTRASRAKDAVQERLAELRKGSDEDKALAQQLSQ